MKQRLPACVVSICTLLCLSLSVSGAETAEGHPNIILFLVDDMGLMDTAVPFVVDANGQPVWESASRSIFAT